MESILLSDVLTIFGILLALAGQSWATWRWMSTAMNDISESSRGRDKELHDKIDDRERNLRGETERVHSRVDEVRESYVRRDDFRIAMDRIETKLDKLIEAKSSGQG